MIRASRRTRTTRASFPRTRGDDPERAKLTREAGRALIERWRALKTRELGLLRTLADLNVDPGARRAYFEARENEAYRLEGRAARQMLDETKRRINETPVASGDTLLANTRAIGHVTVESRESYIRRKMAENGWDRQTAIAQATHLYPEDMEDLRAPWANRNLYTGEGGHSPDTAAQALYDDGRIADPTVDAFWDAVRGDIEVVSKAKKREIEAAEAEAAAALAWGKERHDQTLAAIEMQDDAVGLGMGEARSSIGGARTTNHVGNDVLTTLEDLDVCKDVFFDLKGRGRLRVTLGQDGPGGFGIMHIVEGRMLKDGQDLDGAIRTVLRVVEAATHGKFLRHKQGRDNYGKDGAIAVIAYEKDKADGTPGKGDFVLTGYEEFTSEAERKRADARAAALRRAGRYALPPHARSEEVVAALHRIIANLQNARKSDSARSSIGGLFTSSPALYDKPSLRAIGSGLGTRVFGWGLYASDNRGMVERVYSKLLRENLDDDARPSILEQVWWDNRPEDDKTHLLPYFDVITGETRKFVNEAIEGIASDYALDDDAVSRYFGEDWQTRDMTGQEFYDLVTQVIGENLFSLDIDPEQAASQALAYYDIDGIVYPVGVDRVEAGYEGNNYVAFSDEHMRVVRRWVWNAATEEFELDRSFTPPTPTMAEARATAGDDQAIAEAQASRSSIIGRIGARRLDWAGYRLTEDEHGTRRLVQGQDGRTLFEGLRDADAEVKARVAGASAMTPYGYEMDAYFRHALELTEGEIRDETGTWRRQTYDDLTFKAQRDKILRGQDDATQGILNQFTNAKTLEALEKLAKKHLDVTAMTWGPKEGGGFEVTVEYDDDVIWWNTYGSETGALNSMRRIFLNRYANRTSEARSSISGRRLSKKKPIEAMTYGARVGVFREAQKRPSNGSGIDEKRFVHVADLPQWAEELGLSGPLMANGSVLRKLAKKHNINARAFAKLIESIERPVAAFIELPDKNLGGRNRDNHAVVLILEEHIPDRNGLPAPSSVVVLTNREGYTKLVTTYGLDSKGETKYVGAVNKGLMQWVDKERAKKLPLLAATILALDSFNGASGPSTRTIAYPGAEVNAEVDPQATSARQKDAHGVYPDASEDIARSSIGGWVRHRRKTRRYAEELREDTARHAQAFAEGDRETAAFAPTLHENTILVRDGPDFKDDDPRVRILHDASPIVIGW